MVGGTLHLDIPTENRFTFGLEAFFERFAMDGTGDDSIGRSVSATYVGAALAPTIRLTRLMYTVEIRVGVAAGFVYTPSLRITSDHGDFSLLSDGVGYRLGGLVMGTAWVTSSLGIGVALGFDHTFLTGQSILLPDEGFRPSVATTNVWSNQPFLRLSAEYRFE